MRAAGRPLHLVYLLKGLPREWETSLVHEILTLESLGHRVTVVSRLSRDRRKIWRAFSTIKGRVRFIHEDDPLIQLRAIPSQLAVFAQSPLRYRRRLRTALASNHPNRLRRMLHAGMLAHRVRHMGADHLHFLSAHSRIARVVSSLSGLSYTVTSHSRDSGVRGGISRLVMAGECADPRAVELLIRVTEDPGMTQTNRLKPLILVVAPPPGLRGFLGLRLRQQGFEVKEERCVGLSPGRLLDCAPEVVLAGADVDGADAFRLLKRLRADRSTRHIPFILMAEQENRELRLETFRQGADGFFLTTHDVEELLARIENLLKRESVGSRSRAHRRRRGISGQLENLPLPEIVQVLHMGKRTGCVTLSSGGVQGKIWFHEGELVHAELDAADGEPAFFALMHWSEGEFSIQPGVAAPRRTIKNDPMFLVIEALRRVDEARLAAS
jgi:DNA-binding NarL/FixJ family response regulator